MARFVFYCYLAILFLGCETGQEEYKFFVAGHVYGDPNISQPGMHPPFVNIIDSLNANPDISMGFLTGDILKGYKDKRFPKAAVEDLISFDMPIHIAAGNHDIHEDFESYFKQKYFYNFVQGDDLFIVLTPGLTDWNIEGEQLAFLQQTLDEHAASTRRIFIFMHELIWWSPYGKYKNTKINYLPNYPGSNNYNEVVKPILLSLDKPVIIFAGDLGATAAVSPYMHGNEGNITYFATGMGSGIYDNYMTVTVEKNRVIVDLIGLDKLEDQQFEISTRN